MLGFTMTILYQIGSTIEKLGQYIKMVKKKLNLDPKYKNYVKNSTTNLRHNI